MPEEQEKKEQGDSPPVVNTPPSMDPSQFRKIGIPRWFPFLPVYVEIVLRPVFVLSIIVIAVMLTVSVLKDGDGNVREKTYSEKNAKIEPEEYTPKDLAKRDYENAVQVMPRTPLYPPDPQGEESLVKGFQSAWSDFALAVKRDPDLIKAKAMAAYCRARYFYHWAESEKRSPDITVIDECCKELSEVIDQDKQNHEYWIMRGQVRLILSWPRGKWKQNAGEVLIFAKAKKDFDHAIQLYPDQAEAYFYRGCVEIMAASDFFMEPKWAGNSFALKQEEVDRRTAILSAAVPFLKNAVHLDKNNRFYSRVLKNTEERIKALEPYHSVRKADAAEVFEHNKRAVVLLWNRKGFATGFTVWNHAGYVLFLTNRHVAEKAPEGNIRVTRFDRKTFNAKVFKMSDTFDLALVGLDVRNPEDWPLVKAIDCRERVERVWIKGSHIADFAVQEESLNIGDEIVIIGHPGCLQEDGSIISLSWSMNKGIVSNLKPNQGIIQFDASGNPGNSGGPILGMKGRIAGVLVGSYLGIEETSSGPEKRRLESVMTGVSAEAVKAFVEKWGFEWMREGNHHTEKQ